MIRWMAWAIAALLKPKALLVAENLCFRQQLIVRQRGRPSSSHVDGLDASLIGSSSAEMVLPGDSAEFTVELYEPVALAEHSRFAIREGGRTVGAGIVTRIVE